MLITAEKRLRVFSSSCSTSFPASIQWLAGGVRAAQEGILLRELDVMVTSGTLTQRASWSREGLAKLLQCLGVE